MSMGVLERFIYTRIEMAQSLIRFIIYLCNELGGTMVLGATV